MASRATEGGASGEHNESATHTDADSHGKRKRAKYAARACHYCQRRKIKCVGANPCNPCQNRGQPCQRADTDEADADRVEHSTGSRDRNTESLIEILLRRVVQLEQKLEATKDANHNVQASSLDNSTANGQQLQSPRSTSSPSGSLSKRVLDSQRLIWDDNSAFTGEPSVTYNLDQMENRLERLGVDRPERPASPRTQPLTPNVRAPTPEQDVLDSRITWRRTGSIRQLLELHSIAFEYDEWKSSLTSYTVEVQSLYPFLFPPSILEQYEELWTSYCQDRCAPVVNNQDVDLKIAQVFLCLATGRCTTTNRSSGYTGRHSAGWSLYCVATDLIGDVLNLCGNSTSPILQLQTLCLIVVYLFRLDANERAQNVLALAISHAHSLGINRRSIISKMPHFQDEMFRRIWWCLYVLDRRLCFETGRPFFILDMNTDTDLPLDVDDAWLSDHKASTLTTKELEIPLVIDAAASKVSPIVFLKCMIDYTRISAKVWEAVYAAPVAQKPLSNLLREFVETSLDQWRQSLPLALATENPQLPLSPSGTENILTVDPNAQQRFLLHMRFCYMRLMVRKPVLQPATDDLSRTLTCLDLADTIIQAFISAPESLRVLKFPFLQYLLGATMAALSILISEPSLQGAHAKMTLSAAELLKRACYLSWISGRTTRTIARLYALVHSTLLPKERSMQASVTATRGADPGHVNPMHTIGDQHGETTTITYNNHPRSVYSSNVGSKELQRETSQRQESRTGLGRNYPPRPAGDFSAPAQSQGEPSIESMDFSWPELNMDEFDFEHSLGGRNTLLSPSHDCTLSWDSNSAAWLDSLFIPPATPNVHFQ